MMAQKNILKAKWFWQDYNGTSWNNVQYANSGEEGLGSYVYPKGHNRPKSLFYHYQVSGLDANKHKLDKVEFVIIIRKFKESENSLPSIKVFNGDNNAPYRTSPIKTVSSYTRRKNQFWYDEYTIAYNITGVTIAQLKNLIVEVDWKKSKVNYQTTISVNRGRLEVKYHNKEPKWSLYNTLFKYSETVDGTIGWKLTAKNTGDCGSNSVTLTLPKGMSVASSTGDGSYNTSNKTWSIGNTCKGGSATRVFYLKSSTVGTKEIKAYNNSVYATKPYIIREVTWLPSVPSIGDISQTNRDDIITYIFYQTFAKESNQYFDINIIGMAENHPSGVACYNITSSSNVTLSTPLKTYAELIDSDGNVESIKTDVSGSGTDNLLCLNVNPNEDFNATVRIYMYCSNDNDGTINTETNTSTFTDTFPILEARGNIFTVADDVSRDMTYVQNSMNIGVETDWTIITKPHRHNFFDEKKNLMELEIEKEIAYIGVIPLSRCHKADVTATSKNSLIENRYLNRAYYGKKGDYDEDIKMTLRMKWQDVATLQGLCEMDKPIPIDTIPSRADGDPLNHRGWAEIYEVSNIKKINDMLYECDVSVKYLTHDILTKFNITEAQKITEANIKYYLSLIHDYNGDILDLFQLNYYEFWNTLEDANGDKIGSYSIEPSANLTLSRDLNRYSEYDIVWRNTLPSLMSEDYDGNWEMALQVWNKNTQQVLFEHSYSNFKHYDFNNNLAVNTTDADTKYLSSNNNYETLNHEKLSLGFDSLAPLLEDSKEATHFNTMENIVITDPTDQFEVFLLDSQNKGIANQVVKVYVTSDDGFSNSFNIVSDIYGRLLFDLTWGNGLYNIKIVFNENDTYRGCTYNTEVEIQYNEVEYHFAYPTSSTTFINNNGYYTCTLLDSSDSPVANTTVHYSFKKIGEDYEHEETLKTNASGKVSIPVIRETGSHMIRVNFKGYSSGGTTYQPCQFEEQIDVLNNKTDVIIEADNVSLVQGDSEKQYSIILRNATTNATLDGATLKFAFYNNDETFVLTATTNSYGVGSVPLYLKGGAWKVDIIYDGGTIFNPLIVTREAIVENFEQVATKIICEDATFNENKLLLGEQDYFKFNLFDENDNPIKLEPVGVKIYDSTGSTTYIDTVFTTRDDGSVTVPFISHSENVLVSINYKGSVKYLSSNNNCTLSFETVLNKTTTSLTKGTRTVTDANNNSVTEDYVQYKINNVEQNDWQSDYCVVYSSDNERLTSDSEQMDKWILEDGWGVNNNNLPVGNYKVTIFKKGDANNYSICRTLTIHTKVGSDNWIVAWMSLMLENPYEDGDLSYEYLSDTTSLKTDDFAHMRFTFNFWIPNNTVVTAKNGYQSSSTYANTYKTITRETVNAQGNKVTYFDIYCKVANYKGWHFDFENPIALGTSGWTLDANTVSNGTKSAVTVAQTGFAVDNETYQDLSVSINNSDGTIKYSQGFYIIKCFNNETAEEMYYYSYIYDNLNPSKITFELLKSLKQSGNNWTLEIFVAHDSTHKCGYLIANGRITTDTVIVAETTTIFTSADDYTQKGESITFTETGFNYSGDS